MGLGFWEDEALMEKKEVENGGGGVLKERQEMGLA